MIIDGVYLSTVKRNENTGFTVFKFKYYGPAHDRYIIYVRARIPVYVREMPLRIEGEFYNKTNFNATKVSEKISDNDISIAYLSNKDFCGIGPKRAKLIVDTLGPDIFSLVESNDCVDKLKSIKGIPENVAKELVVKVRNTLIQRQVFEFMLKYYGSVVPAAKIAEKYKYKALDKLKENPYICCMEFEVPFYTADAIAKDLGINYLDRKRAEAIIFEALRMSSSQGNTFVYQSELNKNILFIVKNSAFHQSIPLTFFASIMVKCKWLVIEKDNAGNTRVFKRSLWLCENEAARHINRLRADSLSLPYKDDIAKIIEKEMDIKYHKVQIKSFELLKNTGIKILTGGPGTGKTTLLNGLIRAFEKLNPHSKVVLCSPTGRAAQRMSEQTGRCASTIHKLLEIKPYEDVFTSRDSVHPIDADFIIVDEFSMIDIEIMSIFLNAIKSKTLILFVGDIDQLPSVGPGSVMSDLIKSGVIETYKLTKVYRQTSGSVIIDNANKIIAGRNDLEFTDNFKLINLSEDEKFNDKVEEILKENKTFNTANTEVLTTVKKNDGGTFSINRIIQKRLFGESDCYMSSFRLGDKIIINQNDYSLGVFNGDMGYVEHITENGFEVRINNELILIPNTEVEIMSLAYAITTHKSQGSEFENIIIVLTPEPTSMLQRNLIYTAITRAKTNVIIISKDGSFEKSIVQNTVIKRNTSLCEKILK